LYQGDGKKGSIHQPFYGTYIENFMLRQNAEKLMLGKCFSGKQIPIRRRRRLGMAVAEITPAASQLTQIDKMPAAGCQL